MGTLRAFAERWLLVVRSAPHTHDLGYCTQDIILPLRRLKLMCRASASCPGFTHASWSTSRTAQHFPRRVHLLLAAGHSPQPHCRLFPCPSQQFCSFTHRL